MLSSFPTETTRNNQHFLKGQGLLSTAMVNSHCILRKTNDSFLGFCFFQDISSRSLWMNMAVGGSPASGKKSESRLRSGASHWEKENPGIWTDQWYNDSTDQGTIWGDCTDSSLAGSEKAGWTLNWVRTHSQNPQSNTTGPEDENQGVLLASHWETGSGHLLWNSALSCDRMLCSWTQLWSPKQDQHGWHGNALPLHEGLHRRSLFRERESKSSPSMGAPDSLSNPKASALNTYTWGTLNELSR